MPERGAPDVFLVSGGARGVTAACVVALAAARGGAFLLVGRTSLAPEPLLDDTVDDVADDVRRRRIAAALVARGEKATPFAVEQVVRRGRARQEIARTLAQIERAGGRARYLAVDVTDGAALRQAIVGAGLGPVTGVIHGAGALADRRIEAKTDDDVARVLATKVHGLRAMLAAVDEAALAHLALFGSTSGLHGNVGQADYAAANAVLDKFAHAFARRYPACRTVVFDWGPWDGGMVTPSLRALFASRGVAVMPVATGARAFVEVLTGAGAAVQVVVNDVVAPDARAEPVAAPGGGPVGGGPSTLRASRLLGVDANPFLRDHVIGGHPVLPAAFAGLWMANLCAQADPTHRFVSLTDFRVLKGLAFDGGAAERYQAEAGDEQVTADAVARTVTITSTARDRKPRYHYRGTVRLASAPPAAPAPRPVDLAGDPRLAAMRPYADGALFHGPVFQAITRVVSLGPRHITVACRHPRPAIERLGQFAPVAFDAVALDVQFQCLGLWAHHVMKTAALPTSWARLDVFAPTPDQFFVTAEVEGQSEFAVRATIDLHDGDGAIIARARGVELTVHRPVPAPRPPTAAEPPGPATPEPEAPAPGAQLAAPPPRVAVAPRPRVAGTRGVAFDRRAIVRALRDVDAPAFVARFGERLGVTRDPARGDDARAHGELLAELPPMPPSRFGAASFRRAHGVDQAYMAGAMAKGIATEELVIALGQAGLLASFGAGGLPVERIEQAVVRVQAALGTRPHAFNLLHSPRKLATEDATVDVYLRHGVRTVEASSYIDLTPSIVRYRVTGLARRPDGTIAADHRVIVKLSRVELGRRFMQPPPAALVAALLAAGRITRAQAELAPHVPLADDVTVEADSGGHSDNRPLVGILPAMLALRDEVQRLERYPVPVRVGAAGGIATPQAVLAAFTMGADYVVTGSINQACLEAGTSAHVKQLLAAVEMTDVAMAPDSDMFEHGVRVQVVKQRSLFAMRAQKLHACYQRYDSVEAIPAGERTQLEQQIFRDSLDAIWHATAQYLAAHKPEQLARAVDPKVKMALLFKWYLGQSSRWALEGLAGRELDYQIWCGPAMGAFNGWARGTYLERPENRRVADVARVLMAEAAYLHRVQQLRLAGLATDLGLQGAA